MSRLATRRRLTIGDDWSQDVHFGNKSELRYSYHVVCNEHYHGEACSSYCRPRNDTFGHYTCDASGARRCLEGWRDEYCSDRRCSHWPSTAHRNQNHQLSRPIPVNEATQSKTNHRNTQMVLKGTTSVCVCSACSLCNVFLLSTISWISLNSCVIFIKQWVFWIFSFISSWNVTSKEVVIKWSSFKKDFNSEASFKFVHEWKLGTPDRIKDRLSSASLH